MNGTSATLRIRIFASSLIMIGGSLVVDPVLSRGHYRWPIALFVFVFGLFVFIKGDALRTFRQWAFIAIVAYFGCAIVAGGSSGLSDSGRGLLFRLVATVFFLYCFRFKHVFDEPFDSSRALCISRWTDRRANFCGCEAGESVCATPLARQNSPKKIPSNVSLTGHTHK